MQSLPLDEIFGENPPIGGFLEKYQVEFITSLLTQEEKEFLQKISDEDPAVQAMIEALRTYTWDGDL